MLFTHLRAADRKALQTAAFDQRAGVIPFRPLEKAARAWVFERLLFPAAAKEFLHPGVHPVRSVRRQPHGGGYHHRLFLHEHAVPVAQRHIVLRDFPYVPVRIKRFGPEQDVLHLTAVSARVHKDCAADRTGNAVSEFQPRKPLLPRETAELLQRQAGRTDQRFLPPQDRPRRSAGKPQDNAPYTVVADQHIGAVAQKQNRDFLPAAGLQHTGNRGGVRRGHQKVGRSADLKRGVLRHRGLLLRRAAQSAAAFYQFGKPQIVSSVP